HRRHYRRYTIHATQCQRCGGSDRRQLGVDRSVRAGKRRFFHDCRRDPNQRHVCRSARRCDHESQRLENPDRVHRHGRDDQSSYSIKVRTTDQDGLFFEKTLSVTVTDVDEIPPTTTIDSHPATPTSSTTANFTFSAMDTGGSGVNHLEYLLDGGSFTTGTSPQ